MPTVSPTLWKDRAARAAVQGNAPSANPDRPDHLRELGTGVHRVPEPRVQPILPTGWPVAAVLPVVLPRPLTPEQIAQLYDPVTNPAGCRSTFQDFSVNVFGQRPRNAWTAAERAAGVGFAKLPFDNVGVQYGLQALRAGAITPEQFAYVAFPYAPGGRALDTYLAKLPLKGDVGQHRYVDSCSASTRARLSGVTKVQKRQPGHHGQRRKRCLAQRWAWRCRTRMRCWEPFSSLAYSVPPVLTFSEALDQDCTYV